MKIIDAAQVGRRSDGKIGFGTWRAAAQFETISCTEFQRRKCFVVMPFDELRDMVYHAAIRPALERHPQFSFDIVRADELMTVGKISEEIVRDIRDSDLLIVDITEKNPNVFYELGYAHALKKKAILLHKADKAPVSVPFDIQDWRHHRYEFSSSGFDVLQRKLIELIDNQLADVVPSQATAI
jgi:nucleoside 2-deoxyribosyltransferase